MILTSEQYAEHQFAGQNSSQTMYSGSVYSPFQIEHEQFRFHSHTVYDNVLLKKQSFVFLSLRHGIEFLIAT